MNPYNILGIPEESSLLDIKKAYKKNILLFHPDKNKSIEAINTFMLVKKAYELLIDNNFNKFINIISLEDIDEFKFIIMIFLKDMNIVNKIFIEKHDKKYYLVISKDLLSKNTDNNILPNEFVESKFVIIIV